MSAGRFRARVVLLGDSITQLGYSEQGWVGLLSHYFSRKADVINRGYSGYNTRLALHIAPEVLPAGSGNSLTTIFFGANDAASPDGHPIETAKPLQHVPLEEYESNLRALIGMARQATKEDGVVIVLAPPPLDRTRWPDRCNARTGQYAAAAGRAVAASAPLPGCPVLFLDLFSLFLGLGLGQAGSEAGGAGAQASGSCAWPEVVEGQPCPAWVSCLNDGIHLAPAGNAMVANAIISALPSHLQADSFPLDFPIWREVPTAGPALAEALGQDRLKELRAKPQPLTR